MASVQRSSRTSDSPKLGRVALVEDEVDHGQYGPEAVWEVTVGRHPIGMRASRILP
jgi:hypothetical protein